MYLLAQLRDSSSLTAEKRKKSGLKIKEGIRRQFQHVGQNSYPLTVWTFEKKETKAERYRAALRYQLTTRGL